MRRGIGLVWLLLMTATAAWAEEGSPRIEETAAADEVLAAVRQGDNETLQRLARRAQPDPWLVADILIGRGEHAAAAAFAKETRGKDVEQLPVYVAGRKDKPDDEASRKAFAAWRAAFDARDEAAYRLALKDVRPDRSSVIGVYVASLQVLAMRGRVEATALRDAASAAADAALELGWLYQAARVLHGNAYIAYRNGRYRLAAGQYEKALEIQERRGDEAAVALTLHNLGNVQNGLGRLREAERYYRRALALREQHGVPADVAASLIDLAALQLALGDRRYARTLYRRGIEQAKKAEQHAWLANALEGYAHVLSAEGAHAQAREHHERALRLREKLGDRLAVASSLHNLGIVESEAGRADEALAHFHRALDLRVELRHAAHVLQTLRAIGQAHRRAGHLERAREAYEQARRVHQNMGDAAGALHARAMMGAILAEQGAHEKAKRALEAVGRDARASRDPFVTTLAATELAALHLAADRPAEALAAAFPCIGAARAVGKDVAARFFAVGAAAAVRAEMAEAACTFLDAGRAGALREHVSARDALLAHVVPEALQQEEAAARAAYARHAAEARGSHPLAERRARALAAHEARARLDVAGLRIYEDARRATRARAPESERLESVQGGLRDSEALVLYGQHADDVLALVVTPKRASTHTVGSASRIEKLVEAVRAGTGEAALGAALQTLRKQLVVPLALEPAVKRVLVSPAGALWHVPPSVLFERPAAFVPSASTLVLLRAKPSERGKGVLAIGDPRALAMGRRLPRLPGAAVEARSVGDQVLIGTKATRDRVLTALASRKRWRALHCACHASIDTRDATSAGLLLASTAQDAGVLSVVDVLRMDVRADLVVLSADRSAQGQLRPGEGMLGLPRALLMGGARHVLASLWHVDDAAALALMTKFHELWNPKGGAGIGPAEALYEAQAHVRSQEAWQHPRYWAGWVLYGLPD